MKYIVLLLLLLCSAAFAETKADLCRDKLYAFNWEVGKTVEHKAEDIILKENERSGCCSHHGGVCGCSNGRALCCDGTLSPSCGCD